MQWKTATTTKNDAATTMEQLNDAHDHAHAHAHTAHETNRNEMHDWAAKMKQNIIR